MRATGSERESLLRVAAAAAGAHDLDQVVELAAEEARHAVGAASLSVSRWERDRGTLRTIVNVGELGPGEKRYPEDEHYSLREDRGAARLLQEGIAYFHAIDSAGIDPFSAGRLVRLDKESEVAVPVVVEGDSWGEVYATTAPGQPHFSSTDVRFLEAVAGQLAVAIGRAELFSRVSRLAYEDPLTGLPNRRAIEGRLTRAAARADERGGSLAVLLCDLDELKSINDSSGHDAGDDALRRVAAALVGAAAAHPGCLVGRLAGDEFCVVLEDADSEDARALAAAALDALAADEHNGTLISCGTAVLGKSVATPTQLLRAADAALYRAKRNGGGQIFSAGSQAAEAIRSRNRRTVRRRPIADRMRDAVNDLIAALEGPLEQAGALARIETVGAALAETLNASAWAVSFAPLGSDSIKTVSLADGRDRRVRGLRLEVDNDEYPLDEYPATARLIRAGAGALVVQRGDRKADSAERALLETYDRNSVLAAAAADHDGTWLLEIYGDEVSAALVDGRLEAALLMRAAVPPRPASISGTALLERRTRHVRLLCAMGARLPAAAGGAELLRAAVEEVESGMGALGVAAVRLRDDGIHVLEAGAGVFAAPEMAGHPGRAGTGLLGRCLRKGVVVLVGDVDLEPDYAVTEVSVDTRSELDVPIRVNGVVWGALSVQARHVDAFDEEDAHVMRAVADLVGCAMQGGAPLLPPVRLPASP